MRDWVIKKLGGYPTIEDAIEGITQDKDKYTILTLAVKRLFNTIGSDDILKTNEVGQWMHEGKIMTDAKARLIQAEAKQLLDTTLWKILQDDVKYQANRKMFLLAENEMQLVSGKLWMYTLDAFKTRLESLSKGSGLFNSK